MALPFIVGAMVIAAGVTSYMKGSNAADTNQEAKDIVKEARGNYCVARERLQKAKARACDSLSTLGQIKVRVLAKDMISYVYLLKKLKADSQVSQMVSDTQWEEIYREIKCMSRLLVDWREREKEGTAVREKITFGACSVIPVEENAEQCNGVAALMAREQEVMATEDLSQVDGIINFDEDISGLSFLLDGFDLEKKANKNLERAKNYYVKVKEANQQMNLVSDAFQAASGRANLLIDLIGKIHKKFHEAMGQLQEEKSGVPNVDIADQVNLEVLEKLLNLVVAMRKILYLPILYENGSVTRESFLMYHEIKDALKKMDA